MSGGYYPQASAPSPLTERGGSPAMGPGQMGKNYMQYSMGGAYDDDNYNLYASANYGSDGSASLTMEGRPQREENRPLSSGGAPPRQGFEVMNKEALGSNPSPSPSPNSSPNAPSPNAPSNPSSNVSSNLPTIQNPNYYACPVCNQLAIRTSGCQYRSAACSRGHAWYLNNGKKQVGVSPEQ